MHHQYAKHPFHYTSRDIRSNNILQAEDGVLAADRALSVSHKELFNDASYSTFCCILIAHLLTTTENFLHTLPVVSTLNNPAIFHVFIQTQHIEYESAVLYTNNSKFARNMKEQSKSNYVTNRLTTVLFTIYLIALYWILLLKLGVRFSYMATRRANVIPFNEPFLLTGENILNVVIFVPLGIYTGILFGRWMLGKKLLFFLLLSVVVEGLQYLLRLGAFDVTDVITNTTGGIIGLVIFKAIEKAFNNHGKTQKFINSIAVTGTVLMILLLLLLKMKMLPVRYQ